MKLSAADKEIVCSKCKRIAWGSGIAKTKNPAEHRLIVKFIEEQSRGPVEPDYITTYEWELCIDCRPKVESELFDAIIKICGFPLYVR